jgi:GntR family transcriptional repressor for pyruvate dehydrogenase complex
VTHQIWTPIGQPGTLSERIAAQIEKLLHDEQLRPGDRLPSEREMATLLGVSRASLREAVRTLEARGRLHVRHGQGVFVAAPAAERQLRTALADGDHDLDELFAMREVLEVPAAGWAATRVTAPQIRELRAILAELDETFDQDEPDFSQLASLDAAFHLGIAEAGGNRFMRQTSHVLHTILLSGMETTLLIPGRRERSRVEHARILAALEAHDAAGARNAARAHIRAAHRAALGKRRG